MANTNEIPFKVNFDFGDGEKSIGKYKSEFKELKQFIEESQVALEELKKAGAAESVIAAKTAEIAQAEAQIKGVEKTVESLTQEMLNFNVAGKSIGEVRQAYSNLQVIVNSTVEGTEEHAKAVIKLGETKGVINDLRQQMLALDPEKRVAAFAKLGSTIASGFAAAQAATALFGQENEDLVKTLVKVQAATALAQGIQGLTGLKKALNDVALIIKALNFSTLFGLLSLITALGVAFVALSKATRTHSEEVNKLNKEYEAQKKTTSDRQKQIENEIIALTGVAGAEEAIIRLRKEGVELTTKELQASVKRQEAAYAEAKSYNTAYQSFLQFFSGISSAAEIEFAASKGKQLKELQQGIQDTKDLLLKSEAETTAQQTALQNKQHEDKLKLLQSEKDLIETSVTQQIKVEREKLEVIRSSTTASTEEKLVAEQEFIQKSSQIIETSIRASADKQIEIERQKNAEIQNSAVASAEVKRAAQNEYNTSVIKITESRDKQLDALRKQNFEEEITALEAHRLRLQTMGESSILVEVEIENKKLEFLKNSGKATKAEIELAEATHASRMEEIFQKQVDDAIKAAEEIVNAEKKKWDDLKKFHEINQQVTIETVVQDAEQSQDPVAIENAQYQERLLNLSAFNDQIDALDVDEQEKTKLKNDKAALLAKEHASKLTAIDISEAEKRKQSAEKERDLKINILKDGIKAFGELATSFAGQSKAGQKRAFEINKVANIAEVTMDTIVAA